MYIDTIKGHAVALSIFTKQTNEGPLCGAYLFYGPRSVGKCTTAKAIARSMLCTGSHDVGCRCESCRLFPDHPDYLEIKDTDTTIKVEDIQGVEDFLSLAPFKSQRRIVLIDDAERMNTTSSNRMLKIIEEHSENALIFLISSNPELLSDTIHSRMYPINFEQLTIDDITKILKSSGHEIEKINVLERYIPYLTEGVIKNFKAYLLCQNQALKYIENLSKAEEDDVLGELKDLDAENKLTMFLEMMIIHISDIMKIRYDYPESVCGVTFLDRLEALVHVWSEELCLTSNDRLGNVLKEYRKGMNLKLLPRVEAAVSTIYGFLKKNKK